MFASASSFILSTNDQMHNIQMNGIDVPLGFIAVSFMLSLWSPATGSIQVLDHLMPLVTHVFSILFESF